MRRNLLFGLWLVGVPLVLSACGPTPDDDDSSPEDEEAPCEVSVQKHGGTPLVQVRLSTWRTEHPEDEPACSFNEFTLLNEEPWVVGTLTFESDGTPFCIDGVTEGYYPFFRVGPLECEPGEQISVLLNDPDDVLPGGRNDQTTPFDDTLLIVNETDTDLGQLREPSDEVSVDYLAGALIPAGADRRIPTVLPFGLLEGPIVLSSGADSWLAMLEADVHQRTGIALVPDWTAHQGEVCTAVLVSNWLPIIDLAPLTAFDVQLWNGTGVEQLMNLGSLWNSQTLQVYLPPGEWYWGLDGELPRDGIPDWAVGPITCNSGEDLGMIWLGTGDDELEPFEVDP